MTFKRLAAVAAAVAMTLGGIALSSAPAQADGSVPIKAVQAGGFIEAPSGALCGVPCMKSIDGHPSGRTAGVAMAPPANCRYNDSACGYESFNYLCDDGCEVIPRSSVCEPVTFNNAWSSFYNNSGRIVRVYDSGNCTGGYLRFYNGTGTTYFLVTNPDWENKTSSIRFEA